MFVGRWSIRLNIATTHGESRDDNCDIMQSMQIRPSFKKYPTILNIKLYSIETRETTQGHTLLVLKARNLPLEYGFTISNTILDWAQTTLLLVDLYLHK